MPRLSQPARPVPVPAPPPAATSRRWSKTASSALGALVVAGAAAVVPLVGPATGSSGGSPAPAAGTTSGVRPTAVAVADGSRPSEPSGLPEGFADAAPTGARAQRSVLYVGGSAVLRPRGGSATSFPCRAAASLRWHCTVRAVADTAGLPVSTRADVVVLVMTAQDDAATLARALDGLPTALGGARLVILAPVAVTAAKAVATHLPAIRQLALARGAEVIDPVAQHWITAATRRTYLAADGVQPTAAGATYLAGRLAAALTAVAR